MMPTWHRLPSLALAMVAEDLGDGIVQKTARQLVLYHRRSGGLRAFGPTKTGDDAAG